MDLKNVAESTFDETNVDEGVLVLTFKNEENVAQRVSKEIDSSFIQFHFCVKGGAKFIFNQGRYLLDIHEENLCPLAAFISRTQSLTYVFMMT